MARRGAAADRRAGGVPVDRLTRPAAPPAVVAAGLGWTYRGRPRPALVGVSFHLEPGQVLLVMGPSGSGKSTLGRALAGLIPKEVPGEWQGALSVGGIDVASAAREALGSAVGIVFQDPGTQLVMPRVEDEVAFGLENRGWERPAMVPRVREMLEGVGLAGFERRLTATLSGGEQQRLAIVGALAPMPGLLILDEPTANLDPPGTRDVLDTLAAIAARHDRTIVVIEHRVDAVLPIADRVLLLDGRGRQIDFGPPGEVGPRSAAGLDRLGGWVPASWSGWAGSSSALGAGRARAGAATPDRSEPVLRATTLRLRVPATADAPPHDLLDGVGLEIRSGERVALVGPNGAGKSTLLFVLAGLRRPNAGSVLVGDGAHSPDMDPARLRGPALASAVGFVFQDPELGFVGRTVTEEVAAGWSGGTSDVLDAFGLAPLAEVEPFRLSQGEQRRLSIAAASVTRPRALLLDEPTFGLDRSGTEAVVGALDRLLERGQAQVLATHDRRLIGTCARVLALDRGRLVFEGTPAGFLAAPPYEPTEPWSGAIAP